MTEPKRPRSKRDKNALTDAEMVVMKHLRFNVKTEEGKLHGSTVPYFTGIAIVDCLLQSKFASKTQPVGSTAPFFPDRKSAVTFMTRALQNGLFMRIERKKKRRDADVDSERVPKSLRKRVTATGSSDEGGEKAAESSASQVTKETETDKDKEKEKEKKEADKKRKVAKLLPHEDQVFLDSDSIYMWHYDPIRPRNVVLGFLVVFGAIAICLYPIWPHDLQLYTVYVSRTALVILGLLIAVILFRYVLVAIVYLATFGRVTLWLFPNINDEKRGVIDSFKPVYTIAYNDPPKKDKEQSKKDKESVAKKEAERDKEKVAVERQKVEASKPNDDGDKKRARKKKGAKNEPKTTESATVGDDEDNQFEVISRDELSGARL